jgi:magnesium transporter
MSTHRARVYRNGSLESDHVALSDVPEYLGQPDTTVWVDLLEPSDDDLVDLAGILGLPDREVRDVLATRRRPKLDRYPSHAVASLSAVSIDRASGQFTEAEVGALIHDRYLITVREDAGFPIDAVVERWDSLAELGQHGTDILIFGLLDVIIDGYVECLETFYDYYDTAAETTRSEIGTGHYARDPAQQQSFFGWRHSLAQLHRQQLPLAEVARGLIWSPDAQRGDELAPYRRDLTRQLTRIDEEVGAIRALSSDINDGIWSMRDYQQELIAKKVSGWAAILAIPAILTGWFGMNVPYPGSEQGWGLALMIGLTFAMSTAFYLRFRRNGWI